MTKDQKDWWHIFAAGIGEVMLCATERDMAETSGLVEVENVTVIIPQMPSGYLLRKISDKTHFNMATVSVCLKPTKDLVKAASDLWEGKALPANTRIVLPDEIRKGFSRVK